MIKNLKLARTKFGKTTDQSVPKLLNHFGKFGVTERGYCELADMNFD